MTDQDMTVRQRMIRTGILCMCVATLFLGAYRAVQHGYRPPDDAQRHAAKALSDRSWQEILVVRPEFTMDSHPGWHTILHLVAGVTGDDGVALLFFSVVFLFLLVVVPPLFFFKRPEAWIGALLLMIVFAWARMARLFIGRPFIFSIFFILMFCVLWERARDREKPYGVCACYAVLTALSVWIHGTWYLLALPLLALLLCAQWRALLFLSAATALGVLLGAAFSGDPVAFITQMLRHAILAFGKHDVGRQLVGEFQPFGGDPLLLVVTAVLLLWRKARHEQPAECARQPVFVLAMLGWMLGFVAGRFWYDWGWPALLFWIATEIQQAMESGIKRFDTRRPALAGALCLCFFLALSNDAGSRWSTPIPAVPDMENEEHRPWLPDEGGIVYSDNMRLFYTMFFLNPRGPWRYVLGFEPIWMPDDDLEIFRNIQLARHADSGYEPWVAKMTEKDRMILQRSSKPNIAGLEWNEVTALIWSGRLAHEVEDEEETPGIE